MNPLIASKFETKAGVIPASPIPLTGEGGIVDSTISEGHGALSGGIGVGILKGEGDAGGIGAIAVPGAKQGNLKVAKGCG